ncbi:MAG: ATPase, T2SS/T4P/T4SS family [Vicinamibacterales bacterium]
MPLVDSLLTAVVRSDGDALVLHVGEKPYVVAAAGPVELSRQGLGLGAMEGMLSQLLSADALRSLREMGAVEHELEERPASGGDRFTVVAARGGDDIWIELRRHRRVAPTAAPVPAPAPVAAEPIRVEPVAPAPAPVPVAPPVVAASETVVVARAAEPGIRDATRADARRGGSRRQYVTTPAPAPAEASAPAPEPAAIVAEPEAEVYELPTYDVEEMAAEVVTPAFAALEPTPATAELVALEAAADAVAESDDLSTALDVPMAAVADTAADAMPMPAPAAEAVFAAATDPTAFEAPVVELVPAPASAPVEAPAVMPVAPETPVAPAPTVVSEPVVAVAVAPPVVAEPARAVAPPPEAVPAFVIPEPVATPAVAVAAPVPQTAPELAAPAIVPPPARVDATPVSAPAPAAVAPTPAVAVPVSEPTPAATPRPAPVAVPAWPASAHIEASEPRYVPESHPMLPGLASELDAMERDAEASLTATDPLPAVVLSLTRDGARGSGGSSRGAVRPGGIERLLRLASARGASALYLTTQARPAVRVDGDIRLLDGEPALSSGDVEAAVLELAPEGARDKESAEWIRDLQDVGRVRITTFRDYRGPGALLRMIQAKATSAEQLGLVREIQALATEPEGLVIVTGPRASGKSTLVSAFVDLINRQRSDYVITLEGQIRLVHESRGSLISQRELRGNAQEVVSAARAALRENPDVLVIEDLRSPDVLQVALDAAGSGLLVFASVTAASATAALERLVDLCPSDQRRNVRAALAEHLRGVVAQVLLRKAGGGRLAARELVLNTNAVAALVSDGQIAQLPRAIDSGRKLGMAPLNDALVAFVQSGAVDVREAYRKADDKAGLLALLRREGIDTSFVERLA